MNSDPRSERTIATAPIDPDRVDELLACRPELTLDGIRPSADQLTDRVEAMWIPDEPVVYIGKATNLAARVRQYYTTPLDARSPHAGGWPIKLLSNLSDLFVHWAVAPMPELAEQQALAYFVQGVSQTSRDRLFDPDHPYPYANLEGPGGRKRHGIRGARAKRFPKRRHSEAKTPLNQDSADASNPEPKASSGRVTLHEEIVSILEGNANQWMTTKQIARNAAERGTYKKRDGTSNVTAFQVHGRTKNYPHLFERDGSRVRLS